MSLNVILGLVFIILKLTGNIDWSWWWVTLPFYAVDAITIMFLFLHGCLIKINEWWRW